MYRRIDLLVAACAATVAVACGGDDKSANTAPQPVQCPPGQRWDATLNKPCATVCDSAEEAQAYNPSLRLFNESKFNGAP